MFHCESKNIYINLLADVLYISILIYAGYLIYPSIFLVSSGRCATYTLGAIIIGILLPAISLIETITMIATKKIKTMSILNKTRLLVDCLAMWIIVFPSAFGTILARRHDDYSVFLPMFEALAIYRTCGMLFDGLHCYMSAPRESGAKYSSAEKNIVPLIVCAILFWFIIYVKYGVLNNHKYIGSVFSPDFYHRIAPHTRSNPIKITAIIAFVVLLIKHFIIGIYESRKEGAKK